MEQARPTEEKDTWTNGSLEEDRQRLEDQFQNLLMKLNRFDLLQEQMFTAALAMHTKEAATLLQNTRNTQHALERTFNEM